MLSHDSSDKNGHSELLTKTELAQRLSVCEKTVERMASRRVIPYIKLGRSLRFHPTDVDEYIAKYWTFRPLDSSRKKKPSKSHKKKRRVRRRTTLQSNTPRKPPKLKDSGPDDAGNNLRSDRLPEP